MMKLYAVPYGADRRVTFVAGKTLDAAKLHHKEARLPLVNELEAAIVSMMAVPLIDSKGRKAAGTRAQPEQFGVIIPA